MSFAAGEEEELAAALRVITAIATLLYLVAYFTALAALGWVVLVEALPLPYRAFGVGKSSQSPALIDRRLCCRPLVIAGLALPARLAACVQPTDPLLTYDCECCWLAGWQVWLPPCVG